jgi:hypothetical protein
MALAYHATPSLLPAAAMAEVTSRYPTGLTLN